MPENVLYKPSFSNRSIIVTTRAITNASNKTIASTFRQVVFFGPSRSISDRIVYCNPKKIIFHKETTFEYNVYQD